MKNYQDFGLILAAAGSSKRFGSRDKLLIDFQELPLFLHALKTFSHFIPTENIIIVVSPGRQEEFRNITLQHFDKAPIIIAGGSERSLSVLNGLKQLPETIRFAAVHDAARPYLLRKTLQKCLEAARQRGSAVLARPVSDTIKIVDEQGFVLETPPRADLRAAETPQIFERQKLINAYQKALQNHTAKSISDESMAMELNSEEVFLFIHEENNSKITYAYDAQSL
jgi:2-C-methyl-D-erythritol 4-phosphate cytidylyltransferase